MLRTSGVFLLAALTVSGENVTTGPAAFTDYTKQKPGVMRKITLADLPPPFATKSFNNSATLIPRPNGAWPQTLPGFQVTAYATGLERPRIIRRAPNGDIFVAESLAGRVKIVRGKTASVQTFAEGLDKPFGIAFYPPGPNPQFVYIANTGSVIRYPYQNGDLKPRGAKQTVVDSIPGAMFLVGGGHWTRDIAFSNDGQRMFIAVGSRSNVRTTDYNPTEYHRANILEYKADGSGMRVFASGIRNPVGIGVDPHTGEVWTSVNERDGLGDNLVPDYITHVEDGQFFGWPFFYMGGTQDPRQAGAHPELKSKVTTPDVLLQAHSASLGFAFYDGKQFPGEFTDNIFAAAHGSWNKDVRAGYEVIRVPRKNGRATGEYQDFLTGFVTGDGKVWGRPVGVAVADDGALLVSDDVANTIWRVAYSGKK